MIDPNSLRFGRDNCLHCVVHVVRVGQRGIVVPQVVPHVPDDSIGIGADPVLEESSIGRQHCGRVGQTPIAGHGDHGRLCLNRDRNGWDVTLVIGSSMTSTEAAKKTSSVGC